MDKILDKLLNSFNSNELKNVDIRIREELLDSVLMCINQDEENIKICLERLSLIKSLCLSVVNLVNPETYSLVCEVINELKRIKKLIKN